MSEVKEIQIEELINRCLSNKPYNKKLRLYSREEIQDALYYLESNEEYEKCCLMRDFINNRFNHKKNYIKSF